MLTDLGREQISPYIFRDKSSGPATRFIDNELRRKGWSLVEPSSTLLGVHYVVLVTVHIVYLVRRKLTWRFFWSVENPMRPRSTVARILLAEVQSQAHCFNYAGPEDILYT